ncbi:zinc finger protein 862-like [Cardiocondyla obscurior]|uniref:zinc finger protein 862-like n=1 Tax=Cardiocondyla obscurior TaxID=286306 RepID=UPI0039656E01
MTFLIRFIDPKSFNVRTQLIKLIDIDARDCSADKLFNAFKSEVYKLQIPFSNILAQSCDNASVMTGKHLSFKTKLEEKCKNLLTFSCPCYSAALAANAACAVIPHICEEFLRKISTYINNSPKRLAIFNEFTECFQNNTHKILKLCDTRWLTHYSCVDRVLESWDSIQYFLHDMVVNEKSKSAEYLLSLMINVETKEYFLFLKYILNVFNTFNAYFQAAETKIYLLQSKSVDFLVQVCTNFLKLDVLDKILTNLSFNETDNYKPLFEITLGSECEDYLSELMEGHANVVTVIRQNCLQFYITAATEIKKRLPVNNIFLYKLQVFSPQKALFDSNRDSTFNDVSFIAKRLSGFDENSLKQEWLALYSDFSPEEKQSLATISFDEMWQKILKRESNQNPKYPALISLVNAVRLLPYSNADPERTFSILTDLKSKKRNRLSSNTVNATCVFKSALKAKKETAINIKLEKKHLDLMSSETLYALAAKKQKCALTLYAAGDTSVPSSSNDTQ